MIEIALIEETVTMLQLSDPSTYVSFDDAGFYRKISIHLYDVIAIAINFDKKISIRMSIFELEYATYDVTYSYHLSHVNTPKVCN